MGRADACLSAGTVAQVRPLSKPAAEQARERYRRILSEAELEEPPPQAGKGRPKNTPGRNLLRRLKEQEEAVLASALVEGVPSAGCDFHLPQAGAERLRLPAQSVRLSTRHPNRRVGSYEFLQANTQDVKYLVAVESSQVGCVACACHRPPRALYGRIWRPRQCG